jgi:uncharacterized protein YndB with AHSA1/START domain
MADILQDFPILVPPNRVFEGVTQPSLLDQWWTLRSSGQPTIGATYELDFGPNYLWRAVVTRSRPGAAFELRMTHADRDWMDTVVGFDFSPSGSGTQTRFYHRSWPEANEHSRTSCHCWGLYLRLLHRHLEFGETVPYGRRLAV